MRGIKAWVKSRPWLKRMCLWLMRVSTPLAPPHTLAGIHRYWRFFVDYRHFVRLGGNARLLDWYPCLFDNTDKTDFDAHYLYQAAWASNRIFAHRPETHIDVASEVSFAAQLSAFCKVIFVDIRPPQVSLDGFEVRSGLITALPFENSSIVSLSCLHVIEHVGLGRYGDPLQVDGPQLACAEIARVLGPGGQAYISVPIGRPRIGFNGLYVFEADKFPELFPGCRLKEFAMVDTDGSFVTGEKPERMMIRERDTGMDFGLGIYLMEKM